MIRVKSIEIKRFRGIREGAVRDFADVNLLVGRNNSGKSTVVEAIHRVAFSVPENPRDVLNRNLHEIWAGNRGEQHIYPPELWYTLDQTHPINLSADIGDR